MKLLDEWYLKIDEESLHTERMDSSTEEVLKIADGSRFAELHPSYENQTNVSKACLS